MRLLQGLFARSARLHASYSRQSALQQRVFYALKQQREAEEALEKQCVALRALLETQTRTSRHSKSSNTTTTNTTTNNKNSSTSSSGSDHGNNISSSSNNNNNQKQVKPQSTPILRVHLEGRENDCDCDMLLYVGQEIHSPMGRGVVVRIVPALQKIELRLPFGTLFAHIPRVVCWGGVARAALDANSLAALQQEYEDKVRRYLTLPLRERHALRKLIRQHCGDRSDCDATEGGFLDTDSSDEDEEDEDCGFEASSNGGGDGQQLKISDPDRCEVACNSTDNESDAPIITECKTDDRVVGAGFHKQSGGGDDDRIDSTAEPSRHGLYGYDGSNSGSQGLKQSRYLSLHHVPMSVFPSQHVDGADRGGEGRGGGIISRRAVKKQLDTRASEHFSKALLQYLPLAFAPPGKEFILLVTMRSHYARSVSPSWLPPDFADASTVSFHHNDS